MDHERKEKVASLFEELGACRRGKGMNREGGTTIIDSTIVVCANGSDGACIDRVRQMLGELFGASRRGGSND